MKINDAPQNSLEWLVARSGVVTASEFDNLVTAKMEIRKGQMPESYLARKLAERWLGGPLPNYMTIEMEFGKILEEQAIPFYEFTFNEPILRIGLATTDDGRVGCSPDGLIGEDGGIEIKCPQAETHVKYLMAAKLPDDYVAQVHGSLYVTGRKWWKFMSYRRSFPPFVTLIERDEKIQAVIGEALNGFLVKYDLAYRRLCEMNGGEPERKRLVSEKSPTEPTDIVP